MNARQPSSGAAALAEIVAELRYIRVQVDGLTTRFESTEGERRKRAEEMTAQHADMRQALATHDMRLQRVERQACEHEEELRRLESMVGKMSVTVGLLTASAGTIGSAAGLWLLARVLGLI